MQRFDILEGWRALLAWWVVLSHTLSRSGMSRGEARELVAQSEVTGFDPLGWFQHLGFEIINMARYGKLPVYVFVIMSGFVIVHLLSQKQESYRVYIMRRFLRLWPALMFSLVLFASFYVLGLSGGKQDNYWGQFLAEATMMHGLLPNNFDISASNAINGPDWSISLEWQFYLIAPFLMAAFVKGGWRAWIFILACFAALFVGGLNDRTIQIAGEVYKWNSPAALPHMIGFFGLGMGSYYLFKQVKKMNIDLKIPVSVLLLAAFIGVSFQGSEGGTTPMIIWLVVFLTLISAKTWLHTLVDSKPLRWLGKLSYSTYITHMFVLAEAHRHIVRPMSEPETIQQFLLMVVIAWPLILALSVFCFYFIEKPAINFGKKLAKRWSKTPVDKPPQPPAVTIP